MPRGEGVLPIMAYTGRFCPKGVPYSGFRFTKRVGSFLVEVYLSYLSFGSVKGPKGLTDEFLWLYKDSLYIDSCLNLSSTATSLQRKRPLERLLFFVVGKLSHNFGGDLISTIMISDVTKI